MARNRFLTTRLLGLVLFAAAISVPATVTFPDRPTKDFKSVGEVFKAYGDRAWNPTGSGVAIAPHWVLSVAHVGGNLFVQEGKQYTIAKKMAYEDGTDKPADLALFYIPETIKYYSPIADLPYDTALKGQTVWLVGCGETCKRRVDGKGWQPILNSEGPRRAATNIIDDLTTDEYNLGTDGDPKWRRSQALVYDLDDPKHPEKSTIGSKITKDEGGIAAHDSGGGWFVTIRGKAQLVAVSASVASNNGGPKYGYGTLGFGIYLRPYLSWIRANTG